MNASLPLSLGPGDLAGQSPAELLHLLREQQAIIDNAAVGIAFTRDRHFQRCNRRFEEMLGYGASELIGQPAAIVYLDADAYAQMGALAGPVLAAGQPFKSELAMRRKDGTPAWCRIYARAIDPCRTAEGTIWILEDIEAQRAAQEASLQARRELEGIFETAVLGIVVVRDRVVVRCNRRFEELFGYAPGEMVGQSTRLWYLSDEDYRFGSIAYADLQLGQAHRREQMFRHKDGSGFWGLLSGRAFDPALPQTGSVWLFEDISERKERERQMRGALHEQEMIFNNAAMGIMFVQNRIIQRCNRKLEELFGYAPGELPGRSTAMLYPSEADYLEHGRQAYEAIQRGETFIDERQVQRKDGSLFWLRGTARRTDQNDRRKLSGIGAIWILEDVSERHAVQDALLRARSELETRVAERTSELAQANTRLRSEVLERVQAEERVWHIAHHDALTGLPNRSLLLDRLRQTLNQAQRHQHRAAVMFIDLDRFKHINDTLGHEVGDQFLAAVAQRLRAAVRAVDTVARLGGDEFVVILHEISGPDDALMVAEKLLAALIEPIAASGHALHASASIGISVFPDDGDAPQTLMRHADAAMYHAKASGRNNFQFYTEAMNVAAAQFFSIEQRLRAALGQNRFELHYQPLVDLSTRKVCGMEALIRWRDPEEGLISPASFIPVAEETGLILPIGDWVLGEACRQTVAWERAGWPALPVSVNLSPRQFRKKDLVQRVREVLDESGLPAERLELEITESTLMQSVDETYAKLCQLADMGVRLAVDDFGTGYSSLAYLKRFPVHKLKIDQSFVRDLCDDRDDAAIVSAIIALARNLDMTTLAEGVENGAQLQALVDAGCNFCQGYHFSRPLQAGETAGLFTPSALAA